MNSIRRMLTTTSALRSAGSPGPARASSGSPVPARSPSAAPGEGPADTSSNYTSDLGSTAGSVITLKSALSRPNDGKPLAKVSEEPEDNEAVRQTAWRALPLQLQGLPRDRVLTVMQSLAVLQEAGLGEVLSIREMQSAAVTAMALDDVTDYRFLCAWARTPAMWRAAVGDAQPAAHCRLLGKSREEAAALRAEVAAEEREALEVAANSEAALSQAPDAAALARVRGRAMRSGFRRTLKEGAESGKRGYSRCAGFEEVFDTWWEAMLKSDLELRSLGADDYEPQTLGEGPAALFAPADMQPWPLPPPKARRREPSVPQPASARPQALSLGGPAQPKQRIGHARSYGHTVWFATVRSEFYFGQAPKKKERERSPRPAPAAEPWAAGRRRGAGPPCVVSLHLGSAGCGVGVAAWRRLFLEHRLGADGRPKSGIDSGRLLGGVASHFAESSTGRYVPRTIFVDCDPAGLVGAQEARWFSPGDIVQGPQELQGNWPALSNADGSVCQDLLEHVRMHMEQADNPRCFILTHALQGFVSGGLAAGITTSLADNYGKLFCWNLALAPSKDEVGEQPYSCYNTVFSLSRVKKASSLVTLADNEQLHRLATSKPFGLGLEAPTSADYAGLLGRVVADFTSPMRVGSQVNASDGWSDLLPWKVLSNLVPYPKVNCTFACFAPDRPKAVEDPQTGANSSAVLRCLTRGQLFSVDGGKCMATAMWCRGVAQSLAIDSISTYKNSKECVLADWSPGGFVIGSQPEKLPEGPEVMALRNSTGLLQMSSHWGGAFDFHISNLAGMSPYYDAGLDAGEFGEARTELATDQMTAEELERESAEDECGEVAAGDL